MILRVIAIACVVAIGMAAIAWAIGCAADTTQAPHARHRTHALCASAAAPASSSTQIKPGRWYKTFP
jgi:hypothetical protein